MNYHVIMYMYNNSIVEGSVAQWLEQGTHTPKVVGSNPTRAIKSKLLKILFHNFGEMAEWSKAIDC